MANSTKKHRGRGVQRFGGVTYAQIAEWTGLTVSTVASYGGKRVFNPHDIDDVLRWVNSRRQSKGLPLIGIPEVTQ